MTSPSMSCAVWRTGGAQATAGPPGSGAAEGAAFGSVQPTGLAEITPGVDGGGGTGSDEPTSTRVVSTSGSGTTGGAARGSVGCGVSFSGVSPVIGSLPALAHHRIGAAGRATLSKPRRSARRREGMDESPRWEIEDLTDVHGRIGPDRTALWFGVAVAVIAAVIGFGFVGRVMTPETPVGAEAAIATARPPVVPSDPAAALRISSPVAGALVDAAVITVTGDARQPIGLTHFAVHLGDAVLGWSNVDIPAAGAFSVTIRVFAPPFDVPADLRIDAAAAVDRAAIALTVPIVLRTSDGIWSARRSSRSVRPAIEVEGVGPLVDGHVQIRVETREGRVLARTW